MFMVQTTGNRVDSNVSNYFIPRDSFLKETILGTFLRGRDTNFWKFFYD